MRVPYDRNDLYEDKDDNDNAKVQASDQQLLRCIHGLEVRGRTCEHLLHADCWDIIERVIGPQAEDRLDLLLKAMTKSWSKNSYDVRRLIPLSGERRVGFKIRMYTTHQYRLIPAIDPLEIPALQKLIARCTKDGTEKDSGEIITKPIASTVSSGLGTLPVEIQAMVLNMLTEWDDVNNALEAFSFQLPVFLWRHWFPHDLIFDELDQIPRYKIDWKMLREGVMRLLDTSLAMKNRQRIVRVIKEIREDFLRLLESDNPDQ